MAGTGEIQGRGCHRASPEEEHRPGPPTIRWWTTSGISATSTCTRSTRSQPRRCSSSRSCCRWATLSANAGSVADFVVGTSVAKDRAAITIMPKCASPETKRFGPGYRDAAPPCMSPRAKATFLTNAGPYSFVFDIYDYTGARIVEIDHKAPPKTNLAGTRGRPPFPDGPANNLRMFTPKRDHAALGAFPGRADAKKLVIRYPAPLARSGRASMPRPAWARSRSTTHRRDVRIRSTW